MFNLARQITGNEDVARDLAQDVWLQVYDHLDRFEARADVFTWIYRITVNRTLNHLKREKRRRWVSILDQTVGEALSTEENSVALSLPSGDAPQDRVVEDEQLARHLQRAIQKLHPKYRVPIILFHFEEQSYQQIAETMGLSMTAVRARIARARKQLAKTLGPLLDQL